MSCRQLAVLAIITFLANLQSAFGANTYYVAPTTTGTPNGSFASPFTSITTAMNTAVAGDTIYLRGGTYNLSATISISKSGTAANPYRLLAYPGESPILDFSAQADADGSRGLQIEDAANWWNIKGLTVQYAGDNGVHVLGHNNVFEQIVTRYNRDSGFQLHGTAANNLVLNCDSYENFDPPKAGEDADGFAAKFASLGTGNIFRGSRSWSNSDDGWDTWNSANGVLIQNCWSFDNGINIWGVSGFNGDGDGFKLGKPGGNHVLVNDLAINGTNGVDINENGTGVQVYNVTSFDNNRNWQFDTDTATHILKNNISFAGSSSDDFTSAITSFNTWNGSAFAVNAADFVSTTRVVNSVDLLKQPRKPDGSLPDLGNFLKLTINSNLVDSGTPISFTFGGVTYDLPYNGLAPDLGAFESGISAPALPGDYNADGVVGAADYAVWRARLNTSVTLPNDVTPGIVDDSDFTVWRSHFGAALGGSGVASDLAAVPEPSAALCFALLALLLATSRTAYRSVTYAARRIDFPNMVS